MSAEIVLGVDFGARRVGLAVSFERGPAVALRTLAVKSRRQAVAEVTEAARREKATRIVVGVPRLPSGDLSPTGENALRFVQELSLRVGVPVETADEAYSTAAAEADLRAAGLSAKARARRRDAVAAAGILDGWSRAR